MTSDVVVLQSNHLEKLLGLLQAQGYTTVGPVVRDQAIVYDQIRSLTDLPLGVGDLQEKGVYRLRERGDAALFGYTVGPQSWKKYLYPPRELLQLAEKTASGLQIQAPQAEVPKYALIGVRGCELRAIQIQDKVFLEGPYRDTFYQQRREQVFILAVHCTEPGNTCFCVSMQAGPVAGPGYDLSLTEMLNASEPYYLARAGTVRGQELLDNCSQDQAPAESIAREADLWAQAETRMGRQIDQLQARQLLQSQYLSEHWQNVGARCLSCTNCTMVCPTCFCSSMQEVTDLTGNRSERWREWASCFSLDFTYTAGRPIRQSPGSRYRQWISHKLSSWQEQFNSPGCVGCGRCISWCPVGIDLTEEIEALSQLQVNTKEVTDGN